MPVTDIKHDLDARTLTITAEFAAPVERLAGLRRPAPAGG
jgi:hypothetical protein